MIQSLNEVTLPIVVIILQCYAKAIKIPPKFYNMLYTLLKASLQGTVLRADMDNLEYVVIFEEIRSGRKNYE